MRGKEKGRVLCVWDVRMCSEWERGREKPTVESERVSVRVGE